jgi:beta-glucanase (GH16 family)
MNMHNACKSVGLVAWVLSPASHAGTLEVAGETSDPTPYKWTEEFAGQPLALKDEYRLVFEDQFNAPSVTDERGKGPWFAPVHSPYGAATFDAPSTSNSTYTIRGGLLTLRASKSADGKWHAGSAQTVKGTGEGFAQAYGYFEARMKFPVIPGAWCAFWLKSAAEQWDLRMIRPEIDVIEWYGGDPTGHHRTVHLRRSRSPEFHTPGRLPANWYLSNFSRHADLGGAWHVHGVLITPKLVRIYLDGKEVARFPTLPEHTLAFYPIVSLTLYDKDVQKAVPPIDMQVDYVRVYAPKEPRAPSRVTFD